MSPHRQPWFQPGACSESDYSRARIASQPLEQRFENESPGQNPQVTDKRRRCPRGRARPQKRQSRRQRETSGSVVSASLCNPFPYKVCPFKPYQFKDLVQTVLSVYVLLSSATNQHLVVSNVGIEDQQKFLVFRIIPSFFVI